MALSRDEINEIAKASAQAVLEGLHRYAVEYKELETIAQGLQDSMIEERTAADWYRKRAENAASHVDSTTYLLYKHIADEEDRHFDEFQKRKLELEGETSAGHQGTKALVKIKTTGDSTFSPGSLVSRADYEKEVERIRGFGGKLPSIETYLPEEGGDGNGNGKGEKEPSSEKMPRINPHASALEQDRQLRKQLKWLKEHGFKSAKEAQDAGY